MKRDSVSAAVLILALVTASVVAPSAAQVSWRAPGGVTLNIGMTDADVLRAWGPPTGRIEHEVRRETVWHYGSRKLVFREGKLFTQEDGASAEQAVSAPQVSQTHLPKRGASGKLKEVLSDISTLSGSPDSGSPASGPVAPGFVIPTPIQAGSPPNFPQPNFNMLNANPPPGFPPAFPQEGD
ncbi:MAG: hypothetical protein K1X79_04175 [Oligoflexia bacterium]|nr:hypothetical protein [Oligoflexia bacterium]